MNSIPVRIERRLGRPGALDVSFEMRGGLILVAMAVVFACCFLLGRATSGSAAPPAETGQSVSATPLAAAVPSHLTVAPPIGLTAPPKPVPVHHPKPAPAHVAEPSRPATSETPPSPPVERQVVQAAPAPPPPVTRAPTPEPTPAPEPRPAPAPTRAPPPVSHATPSPGGGSFESSG